MKTIYKAADIMEAHILVGMLEAKHIRAHVAGHYLQGAVGLLAPTGFARVMVAEEDIEIARAVLKEYQNNPASYPEVDQPKNQRRGLFTTPFLFWGVIILLLSWFLF